MTINKWIKRVGAAAHFGQYWIQHKMLKKDTPFIAGLVVNEKCNLHCLQCNVSNRQGIKDLTFGEIEKGLDCFRKMGVSNLYIEGGEPMLWKDDEKNLEHVIGLARTKGFQLVTVYTNGTLTLKSSADTLFVSIDGLRETNNYLRGSGRNVYDKVLQNIKCSAHENIIINYTINNLNECDIESFCQEMSEIKNIKGIFFYFYTPYFGLDSLHVIKEKRNHIIARILLLKQKGYSILNSAAALKAVVQEKWARPSAISHVYANNQLYTCCRSFGNQEACENCGYLAFAEIEQVMKLNPTALWEARRYL